MIASIENVRISVIKLSMKLSNLSNVLSKFLTLVWASFIAILGRIWPVGHRLDTLTVNTWEQSTGVEMIILSDSMMVCLKN